MIIGEVLDFFFIVEFQHRGSKHEYEIMWIKNAPKYKINFNEEIITFVDEYITSNKSLLLIPLQEAQTYN